MERIGAPLRELLGRLRLDEGLTGWKAVDLWADAVGERIAAQTRAVAFRDGTLWVEVASAAWMSELGYLRRRIQDDLNRRIGSEIVKDIRLRVPECSGREIHRETS